MKYVDAPLPTDDTQEKALIATILAQPDLVADLAGFFEPEMLYNPRYREICHSVWGLWRERKPITALTVAEDLLARNKYKITGGVDSLEELVEIDSRGQQEAEPLAAAIHDQYLRREEILAADDIVSNALERGMPLDSRHTAMIDKMRSIQTRGAKDANVLDVKAQQELYMTTLDARDQAPPDDLKFPWPRLRELVASIPPSIMVGVLANPGDGKSTFLDIMAERWWQQGYRGAFYHLEDSPKRKLDRRMSRYSAIPVEILQRVKTGQEKRYLSDEQWKTILAWNQRFGEWPGELYLVHCPNWTMSQILAHAERLHRAKPLDYIIVDYYQKIKTVHQPGLNDALVREAELESFKAFLESSKPPLVGIMAGQFDKASQQQKTARDMGSMKNTSAFNDKAQIGIVLDPRNQEGDTVIDRQLALVRVVKANDWSTGAVQFRFVGSRFFWTDDLRWNVDSGV